MLVLLTMMLATSGLTAQAANKIVGGSGSGYATCDSFQFYSTVKVYFSWLPDYAYDRYGNPYATYIRPYQGDIFLNDPNLAILDDCGPLSWSNRAYFDGGRYSVSTPLGGGNSTCTAWIYDGHNTDHRGGCQYSTYFGVPYNSTYGWGSVYYFGATIYPYSGFFGAFSGKTGSARL